MDRREMLRVLGLAFFPLPSFTLSDQAAGPWAPDAGRFRFHMIGNAHIDPVWLWPWPEGMSVVHSTFRSALDRMVETPEVRFTASSAQFYEWVAENDPQMLEEIRHRVDEGRWDIVGGWWVEPDINLPSGEALVRQGLYGQLLFRKLFGRTAKVAFNPDSFGHAGTLPQILRLQGMENYVFMRPQPHEKTLPADLFWWRGPDESAVLTYRIPISYHDEERADKRLKAIIANFHEPVHELMAFYGMGDHGGGPSRENIRSILEIRNEVGAPAILFSTPDLYFAEIRKGERLNLPVIQDDLQMHAVGCYTAESEMKKNNRMAEILLTTGEKLASLGSLLASFSYPKDDLASAWKKVLFLQFHDSLAGTSLPEHYWVTARQGYGYAMEVANQAIYRSAQKIAWQIPAEDPNSDYLVVFNPHAWNAVLDTEYDLDPLDDKPDMAENRSVLEDETGASFEHQWVQATTVHARQRLAFRAPLPAFGYRQFRVRLVQGAANPSTRIRVGNRKLENEHLQVVFGDDGIVLFDKDSGQQVFVPGTHGARAVVLDDPDDTWSHNVREYSKEIGAFAKSSYRVREEGPLRGRVRVTSTYGQSSLEIDWVLYAGSRNLEARVALDWHEHLKMLKFSFPVYIEDPVPTCEVPYGHIVRPSDGREVPGQRWLDVTGKGGGREYVFTVINDAKYGYSIRGSDLRISAARGAAYAQHIPDGLVPDGVYIWQDQGLQEFRMLLVPHPGTWQDAGVVRLAEEFTTPVLVIYQGIHRGQRPGSASFLSVDAPNIVVSVVKIAEQGGDLIVRCYETAGLPTQATLDLGLVHRRWSGSFRPSEIKTLRVPTGTGEIREVNVLED